MTPAETARLLAFVSAICPSGNRHEMSTEAWYFQLADLHATDVLTAMIQRARRQCDITPRDVRAEVFAIRGQRLAQRSSSPTDAETRFCDPSRVRALRVACPWCGASPGQPCTIPGSDTLLRKAPAHPLRLIIAEGTGHDW
jgi:hypothetical protein